MTGVIYVELFDTVHSPPLKRGGALELSPSGEAAEALGDLRSSVMSDGNGYIGYSDDKGNIAHPMKVHDVFASPIYLLRPREEALFFVQAAREVGLAARYLPIYSRAGAEKASHHATKYAVHLFVKYGHITKPDSLTPETMYQKGEHKVGILITDPARPGEAVDPLKGQEFAFRSQELLLAHDAQNLLHRD